MTSTEKAFDIILGKQDHYISRSDKENFLLSDILDEIELIKDIDIQNFVRAVLLNAPQIWNMPSSFSEDIYPPDEHGEHGEITHIKRVVRILQVLVESHSLPIEQRDILFAAALLHDVTKGVEDDEGMIVYDPYHAYTVETFVERLHILDRKYASENQSSTLHVPEKVAADIMRIIRCQYGIWSVVPETIPVTELELLLHDACRIAMLLPYVVDGMVLEDRWLLDGSLETS